MAIQTKRIPYTGLIRKMIEAGLLTEGKIQEYQLQASKAQMNLISYIIEKASIPPLTIAKLGSEHFGAPLLDLNAYDKTHLPKDYLNEKLIQQHHAMPLYKGVNRLYLAVNDPSNLQAFEDFKFQTRMQIEPIVTEDNKLTAFIDSAFIKEDEDIFQGLDEADIGDIDIQSDEPTETPLEGKEGDDAPIVRYINKILIDAINKGASDIHFEPYEKNYRIRFRQDGILQEIATPPVNLSPRFAARLKVMSRLDISERRVPQDGRFKMRLSKSKSIDFRVSTCPTLFGEKVVMRILDPSSVKLGVDALGFSAPQKEKFLKAVSQPQGMILVTGPTGSGKTVTLYTALNILNVAENNISTAEDPVEINLPGINQVSINLKAGLNFSECLRSFLRQDPDVVMVGEIRDLETAETAVQAAQTGHLVFSTLHTNSAAETVTRMLGMGMPSYNLATSLSMIIAQRLARKLCPKCRVEVKVPAPALYTLGLETSPSEKEITVYRPQGCDLCVNGYKGRIGIYEVMPISAEISKIIMAGGNAIEIERVAKEQGMLTLKQSGLQLARNGITSIEEIERVTKD